MDTHAKVRRFIENNLVILGEKVKLGDDDDIFQLGYVNSLFAMQLLLFVESEFSIVVENEDMEIANFSTVNNIVTLINDKMHA